MLWQDGTCRVILANDRDFPGFCRVIWHAHVPEMTDLSEEDRLRLMRVVFATERAVRDVLQPDKVNLASLGNVTPHLHWHVIPRYLTDKSFPDPVWSPPRRANPQPMLIDSQRLQAKLKSLLGGSTQGQSQPDGED